MLLLTNREEQLTIHDYMKHTFVTEDSAGGAATGSGSGSFMGDKIILPTFLRS